MLRNAPTSIHQDSNNAEADSRFSRTAGKYTGGEFLFPQFGVAIPIQPGDILIAATHREWHCNFKRVVGLRYSIIGYFREGLPIGHLNPRGPDSPILAIALIRDGRGCTRLLPSPVYARLVRSKNESGCPNTQSISSVLLALARGVYRASRVGTMAEGLV